MLPPAAAVETMGLNVLDGRTSPALLDAEADHAALTSAWGC